MDEVFGEGGLRRDRGGQARARGLAIMAAETGARHAAHRLDVRAVIVAHFRVLRLAAHRPPLVAILGIGGGDRLAPRQPGNRGGSGVIIVELADQPVLRVLDRRVVEAAAEPEAMGGQILDRSEEHTSELQSLMRISYAVFCLKKKKKLIVPTQELINSNQDITPY